MTNQIVATAVVIGAIVVGGKGYAAYVESNYVGVQATVTHIETDCSVRNGNRELVEKDTNDLAFMDCDMAVIAASIHGYQESDIKRRNKLTFEYISPADNQKHTAEKVSYARNIKVGDTRNIIAHTSTAEKTIWK